jgi:hypothetical protein
MGSEVQRRLLGLVAIRDEACEQVNEEIAGAAVARVLDLRDVLELVEDRLDERPLAKQEPVGELKELSAHVLAQVGDETQSLGEQEAFGKGRGAGALVANEFAEETPRQAGHWTPVIGIAGSETEREQFATVVDDQLEFEAREPPHRGLPASSVNGNHPVLLDARRMADGKRGGVDEAHPRTLPHLRVQVDRQGHQITRHEGHEARITQELRELWAQVDLDLLRGEAFERPLPRLLEENQDGEDRGWMQPCRASSLACATGVRHWRAPLACVTAQQFTLPPRLEALPKRIYGTKQVA